MCIRDRSYWGHDGTNRHDFFSLCLQLVLALPAIEKKINHYTCVCVSIHIQIYWVFHFSEISLLYIIHRHAYLLWVHFYYNNNYPVSLLSSVVFFIMSRSAEVQYVIRIKNLFSWYMFSSLISFYFHFLFIAIILFYQFFKHKLKKYMYQNTHTCISKHHFYK